MTIDSGQKEAVKFTLLMTLAAVAVKVIGLPNSVIQAKYLGPSLLGVLAIINLILQYAGYAHMGLLQSMARDVPIAYGRGDSRDAKRITDIVYTGLFLTTFVSVGAVWLLYALGFRFKGALTLEHALLVTLIILVNRSNSFFRSHVKAEGKFLVMGKAELIQQCLTPLLSIVLVLLFRLKGVLLALLLSQALTVLFYIRRLGHPRFSLVYDIPRLKALFRTGFLIFINGTLDTIFWSVDLLILAAVLETREVGIYSYALVALNLVLPVAGAVNNLIYRQMMVHGGRHGLQPGSQFKRYVEEPFVCYLALVSLLLGLGLLVYMAMVNTILTEYRESLPIMVLLSLGYTLYVSRYFLTFYLNATNQLTKRFGIVAAALALKAALAFAALKAGYGMIAVALTGTLGFLIVSYPLILFTFRQIYGDNRHGPVFILKTTFLALLMAALLFLFHRHTFIAYAGETALGWRIFGALADMSLKGTVYTVACLGAYALFFRGHNLYGEVKPIAAYLFTGIRYRLKPASKP